MSFAARTHCWLLLRLFPSRTQSLFCRSAFSPVSLVLSCFLGVSQPGGRALGLHLLSFGRFVLDHFSSYSTVPSSLVSTLLFGDSCEPAGSTLSPIVQVTGEDRELCWPCP